MLEEEDFIYWRCFIAQSHCDLFDHVGFIEIVLLLISTYKIIGTGWVAVVIARISSPVVSMGNWAVSRNCAMYWNVIICTGFQCLLTGFNTFGILFVSPAHTEVSAHSTCLCCWTNDGYRGEKGKNVWRWGEERTNRLGGLWGNHY